MFSRRSRYSPRTSSRTSGLLTLGRAAKSNSSSVLGAGNRAAFSRRSAAFRSRSISSSSHSLQQEAEVIDVVGGAPRRDLLALGEHRRQLQRLQVVLQQHRALGLGLAHGATSVEQGVRRPRRRSAATRTPARCGRPSSENSATGRSARCSRITRMLSGSMHADGQRRTRRRRSAAAASTSPAAAAPG